MAHGRTYDALNRLTDARTLALAGGSFRAGYGYNAVGQRTNMTLADGARWRYQYDVHGQLTLGKKSWSDGVPVAGGVGGFSSAVLPAQHQWTDACQAALVRGSGARLVTLDRGFTRFAGLDCRRLCA